MVDDTEDMQRIASPANKMIAAWYLTKIDEAADGYYESISLTRTQKHWGENIWWLGLGNKLEVIKIERQKQ